MADTRLIPASIYDSLKATADAAGGIGNGQVWDHRQPYCGVGMLAAAQGLTFMDVGTTFETCVHPKVAEILTTLGYSVPTLDLGADWSDLVGQSDTVTYAWVHEKLEDGRWRMPFDLWAERMGWVRNEETSDA